MSAINGYSSFYLANPHCGLSSPLLLDAGIALFLAVIAVTGSTFRVGAYELAEQVGGAVSCGVRAVRTIVLRYLSKAELRMGITAITNRVEAFHGFAVADVRRRCARRQRPPTTTRRSSSSTSCWPTAPIYSTTLDLTQAANALAAEAWHIDPDDTISPYITTVIPFGDWCSTSPRPPRPPTGTWPSPWPAGSNPVLKEVDLTALGLAA
jgi:Tn3 transposase DDE domain